MMQHSPIAPHKKSGKALRKPLPFQPKQKIENGFMMRLYKKSCKFAANSSYKDIIKDKDIFYERRDHRKRRLQY